MSIAHSAPLFPTDAPAEAAEAPVQSTTEPQTDPTVAHATLTEIEAGTADALTNGHVEDEAAGGSLPVNADAGDSAANAAGESQWDTGNSMSMSQEWVEVPRDPAETETGLNATPAAQANTQSWADEQPDNPPEAPAADPNDGFHPVQRNRGRGDRDGTFRGGRGGGFRGNRGYRGDGRGRGRGGGGGRGGMPYRGPRRNDES